VSGPGRSPGVSADFRG